MKGINGLKGFTRLPKLFLSLVVCIWLVVTYSATAAEKETQFMRFVDDNAGGGKLQTAIVTYTNPAGVKIHLVAAVHVADTVYYKDLAKTFTGYEALLYEMVKPKDMPAPEPGHRSDSSVSMIQTTLKDMLDLDYQLDAIDYRAKNFVHADLTSEEFERLQDERGESIWSMMLQQIIHEMTKEQKPEAEAQVPDITMAELMLAFLSPDRTRHLKLILARQFDQVEDQLAGLEGPNGSVILTERNKTAVAAVKKALGDGRKDIGLFYGAAHMKGISGMLAEMGFKESSVEWRTAWDMTAKPGDIAVHQVKPGEKPAQPAKQP